MNNKITKLLKEIENDTGIKIINNSTGKIPLFTLPSKPYKQPFGFEIEISFNSIKGRSGFEIHFPSLYIDGNDIDEFSRDIIKAKNIITKLNKMLKEEYSSVWVLQ